MVCRGYTYTLQPDQALEGVLRVQCPPRTGKRADFNVFSVFVNSYKVSRPYQSTFRKYTFIHSFSYSFFLSFILIFYLPSFHSLLYSPFLPFIHCYIFPSFLSFIVIFSLPSFHSLLYFPFLSFIVIFSHSFIHCYTLSSFHSL